MIPALLVEVAPAACRGPAFGIFNMAASFTIVAARVVAGGWWDTYGLPVTFVTGAGLASLALIAFAAIGRPLRR